MKLLRYPDFAPLDNVQFIELRDVAGYRKDLWHLGGLVRLRIGPCVVLIPTNIELGGGGDK